MTYASKYAILDDLLKKASSRIVHVSSDPTTIKPQNTGVSVWISPPTIDFDQWHVAEYSFKIFLIAGRSFDQVKAINTILETIEDLTRAGINMSYAQPATFTADGTSELAAYEVTIKPLDF